MTEPTESSGATPEQTMSERCVTITLDRYNKLVELEERVKLEQQAKVPVDFLTRSIATY